MIKKTLGVLLAIALVAVMTVTAAAAGFTPSAENKQAPEIINQKDSKGNEVAAIILDKDGNEVSGVPSGYLDVVPISEINTLTADDKKILQEAYEQLKSTGSLGDLSADLEKVLKKLYPGMSVKDLTVQDLFYLDVKGVYADYLSQEGNTLRVRFKLSSGAESLIAVLQYMGSKVWNTISEDCITRNADGTVDIVVSSAGPLAFLADGGNLDVDPGAPDSPDTGDHATTALAFGLTGLAAVLSTVYFVMKKRASNNA